MKMQRGTLIEEDTAKVRDDYVARNFTESRARDNNQKSKALFATDFSCYEWSVSDQI